MKRIRYPAAFAWLLCLAAGASAAQFRLTENPKGNFMLTASAETGFENTTISVVCVPASNQYAVILVSPELGMPQRDEDVSFVADGHRLALQRFEQEQESLMLLKDGQAGRDLVDGLSAAATLEVEASGRRIIFPLSESDAVSDFRRSCGFAVN